MKPGVLRIPGRSYYEGGDQAHRAPAPSTGLSAPLHDDTTGTRLINGLYTLVDDLDRDRQVSRGPAKLPSNARRPGEPKEK